MSIRILVLDSKPAKDYGLAVGITLLALLARFALDPFLGDHLPYVTFFVAATITTAYAGFGASLMTVVLGGLAADYFFMSPRHSFVLAGEANYVGLASYFVVTFTIVGFGQALQKARQRAETVTEALRREGIDRTRAEAALRESESRFRSVADTAPVLTWMSDSTKLRTWINKAWLEFTGLTVEQELGNGWSQFVHRDDFERCLSHYTNSFDARAPFTIEYRLRRHDGEYRWFLDNGMPRFGAGGEFIGYIGSCVDITDRKRGEAQLLESEERFRTLADNISQFAWMADAAGWLFWYNQRWYDYTGTTFEDMQGWGWQKVHHPDYIDHVLEKWRSAHITGEPWEDTFPLRGRDGTYRWFLSRAMPIRDGEGKVVRWFGTNTDITELREAEAALRKSEERYRHLYESIDEGFCIIEVLFDERKKAVDYVFLEINPSFERQTGIRDAQGRRMRDIAPQHESHWFDLYGTIALTGESKRFEYPAVELQRWYEGYAYRVGEGHERKVGILFNDITERKQAEEKLRENEKRLRLALEAGQMGAWDVDLLTGLVTWDAKQFELFGLGPRQQPATMDQFYAMVHSDDVPSLTDAVARAETIGSFSHEFRIVRADGTVRWIAASGAIMKNEGGQAVRMVGVNYDVTDRRQTEARLRSFAVELEQLVEARTQELVQSQERLRSLATELNLAEQRERKRLAGELHDYLAQLLVLCRLNLGQVRRTGLPSKAEDMVKETEEVLNNALTYTRTLMAELSPPVLQQQGLPAGLRWLAEQMERRGLTVRVDVGNAAEVRLPDDCAVLLFQSVRELLLNALKHAGCEEVTVRLEQVDGRLRIEIQDDGVGFDFAAATASSPTAMSSKFGLFSIRERMRSLGGWFDLQSVPGEGTTATLVLPLTESEETPVHSAELPRTAAGPRSPYRTSHQQTPKLIRILLVDDHPMMRRGLRSLLASYPNIDVVGEASDGQEAVALADQLQPTLILMDINMPIMNGIDATARIKTRLPGIIIIGLSVHAGEANGEAMKTAGAAVLLTKESAVDELYRAIQTVMSEELKTGRSTGDRTES